MHIVSRLIVRYLAIGDIHGCFKALTTLAEFVPFQSDDVLITLGDYVDRGPNSCAVLDWLISWKQRGKLIALRGNHEMMMLQAHKSEAGLERWFDSGGGKTLASYSHFGDDGKLVDVPDAHWHFLQEETLGWYETDTHIFVHASAYPEVPMADQPDFMLYWHSSHAPAPHRSGKIIVCGNNAQESGKPCSIGHAICVDTWAWGKGWLTCLDVGSGRYWQANELGETRSDCLQEDVADEGNEQ
jgi:serine/threonine protein phosphatase 1